MRHVLNQIANSTYNQSIVKVQICNISPNESRTVIMVIRMEFAAYRGSDT